MQTWRGPTLSETSVSIKNAGMHIIHRQ